MGQSRMIKQIQLVNNQLQVTLQGAIHVEEAANLRRTFLEYVESGHYSFLIDFSAVDYIDSSGLGMLVAIQHRSLQHGGGVTITGLTGLVKAQFELTRLTRVFEMQ